MKYLTLALLTLGALAGNLFADDVVLIAHPSTTEASVKAEDVKNILLGSKTKWDSGPVLKLVVLSAGSVHEQVIKDYTQRTSDQFDKHWKKQVFTGKGIMPQVAKTDAEAVDYVAKTPGAFGYVAKASATSSVKVLTP